MRQQADGENTLDLTTNREKSQTQGDQTARERWRTKGMKDMPDQRHCDKVNDGRGESKEDFTYFYTCYYITKKGCEI